MYFLSDKLAEEIKSDLEKGMKIFKQNEIERFELFVSYSLDTSSGIEKNQITFHETSMSKGYACRIIKDRNKYARAEGNSIEITIKNALKSLTLNEELDGYDFPKVDHKKESLIQKEKLLENKEIEEVLKSFITKERSYNTAIAEVSSSIVFYGIANSSNTFIVSNLQSVSASASVNYKNSSASFFIRARNKKKFYEQLNEFEKAKEIAKKFSCAKKFREEGKKRPVVFREDALAEIISFLFPSLTGLNFANNASKLKILNKEFSEKLSIVNNFENDTLPKVIVDGEGIKTESKEIVKKGIVKNIITNTENLFKFSKKLTEYEKDKSEILKELKAGNCNRFLFSNGLTEGIFVPEIRNEEKANSFDYEKDLLIIEEIQGLHTSNPLSGNFSVSVEHGYIIDSYGEEVPLKKFSISSNIFDVMKNCEFNKNKKIVSGYLIAPELKTEAIVTA
ncbi:MAG: metallopeptidase TldD-related protein [Candidatus Micrarchaeota archaeon]|nr:metallopeptidase TldD-related protein [Candidatus Micrarchaeota archaeon]